MIIALIIYLICCYVTWQLVRYCLIRNPDEEVGFSYIAAIFIPIVHLLLIIVIVKEIVESKKINWKKFFLL
ncbi:hypothetical protein CN506_20595 [Bacillus thuringiensis]|nr:hypothetical protein CN506_20595 [Bacillus thuringiensis]